MPNTSLVDYEVKGIHGLNIAFVDATTIGIYPGVARDHTNVTSIVLDNAIEFSTDNRGVNGMLTGGPVTNTHYALYLIGDSTNQLPTASTASASFDGALTLPAGYDMYRRIGTFCYTSQILSFEQTGSGSDRSYTYKVWQTVLNDGTEGNFTELSLAPFVPPISPVRFSFQGQHSCTAATGSFLLQMTDQAGLTDHSFEVAPGVVANTKNNYEFVSVNNASGDPAVRYEVAANDNLTINIVGYTDSL